MHYVASFTFRTWKQLLPCHFFINQYLPHCTNNLGDMDICSFEPLLQIAGTFFSVLRIADSAK